MGRVGLGKNLFELDRVGLLGGGPPGGFVLGNDVAGDVISWDPGRGMIVFPLDEVVHGGWGGRGDTAADDTVDFAVGFVFVVRVVGGGCGGGLW